MRALITGISGFVGQYLEKLLINHANTVFGTSRTERNEKNYFCVNLFSEQEIALLLKKIKPSHIFHLAGISNVKQSWTARREVIEANTIATINLLEAVKKTDRNIRVITIGSSEEYGSIENGNKKITEESQLNPISPYGVSKVAVSMLIKQSHKADNLDVIHVRPFNHIGPGQRLEFVTSDFANQIALINTCKAQKNQMKIGNLEAIRDFTDVRDIVAAYYEIAIHGIAGEVYNVCSGTGTKIQKILETFLSFSKVPIEIVQDLSKIRPSEVPVMIGSNEKLVNQINWKPKIPLESSLYDIYQYWHATWLRDNLE